MGRSRGQLVSGGRCGRGGARRKQQVDKKKQNEPEWTWMTEWSCWQDKNSHFQLAEWSTPTFACDLLYHLVQNQMDTSISHASIHQLCVYRHTSTLILEYIGTIFVLFSNFNTRFERRTQIPEFRSNGLHQWANFSTCTCWKNDLEHDCGRTWKTWTTSVDRFWCCI